MIDNDGMNKMLDSVSNQGTTSLEYVDLSEINTFPSFERVTKRKSSSLWGVYCAIIRQCCGNSLTLCGDEGMNEYIEEITDSLQANTTLETLTLLSVGEIGVQSIVTVLKNDIGIKTLNLSWEKINTNIIRSRSVHTLFSFSTNDILENKMTESDTNGVVGIRILYEDDDTSHNQLLPPSSDIAVDENFETKTVINLSGKQICDDAVHVLAFGLCNNTTVEELNISNNEITEEGAIIIINCLKRNRTLQKLDLSYNCIGKMINKMLQSIENKETTLFLAYVDLSKNGSSPWDVYCVIIRHCCVNSLTLCGDEGMKEYIKEILDSLQINLTLQSLTLRDIGEYEQQLLKSAVNSFNMSLKRGKIENCGKFRYFSLDMSYCGKNTVVVNIDIHIS